MIYLLGIGYLILLAFLVRFFQAMHRWDEEIQAMTLNKKELG